MKRRAWVLPWLLPVGLLIAWQAATASGLLSNHVLPTLSAVAVAGFRLARTG